MYIYIYVHIWFIKSYRLPSFPVISQTATRSRLGQAKCAACLRGANLKLFWDETEGSRFCRGGNPATNPGFTQKWMV